jgi:hypothetical protein
MFKRAIIITFLMLLNLQAQKYNFDTHSSTLKGKLTNDDIYDADFGRFDAYELPMEEGDYIIMKLKAEFFPLMTVVSPSSEYKIAFPKDSNPEVIFKQEIDETGLWQIYIAGDSTDLGEHSLELCYVSSSTRNLPPNANISTIVDFYLAHAETNFFYFREENCELRDAKIAISIDSQKLLEMGEIFANKMYSNISLFINKYESSFAKISEELSQHLKGSWNIRESKNKIEFKEIEGLRRILLEENSSSLKLIISTK